MISNTQRLELRGRIGVEMTPSRSVSWRESSAHSAQVEAKGSIAAKEGGGGSTPQPALFRCAHHDPGHGIQTAN